jgi:hypothetical protein
MDPFPITSNTLEKKIFTFYYKVLHDKNIYPLYEELYAPLYSDKNCTQKAGYYYISGIKNILDRINNIQIVYITLYFDERIISYNYVRKNKDEINTHITFNNLWKPNTPIGYVNRIILEDDITRQVNINTYN